MKIKDTLGERTVQSIVKYVKEQVLDNTLGATKIPDSFKTEGVFYRLIALPKDSVLALRDKGTPIKLKSPFASSWSLSESGIEAFFENEADQSDLYWGVVLKQRFTKADVIIDITKFAKAYPNLLGKGASKEYIEEQEVLTRKHPSSATQDNVSQLLIEGELQYPEW